MTTNNPDPLEVWSEAFAAYEARMKSRKAPIPNREDYREASKAAAAIIAQHYAPVIADRNATLKALSDPVIVHTNMLAGCIAKPPPSAIWHIYGEELLKDMPADIQTEVIAENERLREQVYHFNNAASQFYQLRTTICVRWHGRTEHAMWMAINRAFDKLEAARQALGAKP